MQPIDRPFRFTWDFVVVWAILVVPAFLLTHRADLGSWYSYCGMLILLPLFATFALYGPVLLARQVIRSGSRGWLVARVFFSIIVVGALLLGGLYISGFYTRRDGGILTFLFTAAATVYLNWRLEHEPRA
jgi:hypothetical protein